MKQTISRRSSLKALSAVGALAAIGASAKTSPAQRSPSVAPTPAEVRALVRERVAQSWFIDTHEHLVEESQRVRFARSGLLPCDDWALLFSHYLNSDLISAGMASKDHQRFLTPGVAPEEKWDLLAPWWPAVKHTGYGQAVRIATERIYGIANLDAASIDKLQSAYEQTRKPGFYSRLLRDVARIESCQVNCLTGEPFKESEQPELLLQDLSIVGMFAGPDLDKLAVPAGVQVKDLSSWHSVIRWWFDRYAPYAVAVKSQNAYARDINYARVPAEKAEPVFKKVLERSQLEPAEKKLIEDHLFWYAVDRATEKGLPVKLHTGYYAGHNTMPLARLRNNAASAGDLCRLSPDTRFVFMHIGYPYYEELLALSKHYANASIDMCWAWIINPSASKDYLKKHLLTAPANKLFTFGGDYIPVEPIVGHAEVARRGITLALSELVDEGWLPLDAALDLVQPIMSENARSTFQLGARVEALRRAPWARPGPAHGSR